MKLAVLSKAASAVKLTRPLLKMQQHSPALLFGAGVIGVVATVVLASKATLKLETVLDEHERNAEKAKNLVEQGDEKYTKADYQKDMTFLYVQTSMKIAKMYAPAVLVGISSIGALTGSHIVLTRRNAALGAAYAAVDKAFREYRERVVKKYGVDADTELRYDMQPHEIVEETEEGPVTRTVMRPGPDGASMYARFFSKENSRHWSPDWGYNVIFVQGQQNYANDKLKAQGYLFLNDVYKALGFDQTPEGQQVGWLYKRKDKNGNPIGDGFVDFGLFREGHEESGERFVNQQDRSVLLDFNVDGPILYTFAQQ